MLLACLASPKSTSPPGGGTFSTVGAFYRYFKSKNELITAIAEEEVGAANEAFAVLTRDGRPRSLAQIMEFVLEFVDGQTGPQGGLRLALPIWAEALRDPVLAAFVNEKYALMRANFVAVAKRAADAGDLPPEADPEAVGAVLFGMVPGYALQRILSGGPDRETYLRGVTALIS
jgi:AcrR family transcriptional regulator